MATFQIFIKTLRGKTITLEVNPGKDKICNVQSKIFEIEGIKPEQQMLTYCGKKLESHHTLKFYKIDQYCTLDLSLKLLSSPTTIVVQLPGNNKDKRINFDPFTTLQNIKQIMHQDQDFKGTSLPVIKSFVHNDVILNYDDIRVTAIDSLWSDLTLHTKFGIPLEESLSIQYQVTYNKHPIIHITSIQPHSGQDYQMPINKLMYEFLRKTNLHPLYYSGYCPFKQLSVTYNNTKLQLLLDDCSEYATPFKSGTNKYINSLQTCRIEEFGLLPQTQLKQIARYFPTCDCCPLEKIDAEVTAIHGHGFVLSSHVSGGDLDENMIIIEAEISDVSFILHNKFYCINATFYKKLDPTVNKNKINLQLYPVMRSPAKLSEKLLMYGYIRSTANRYKISVPVDIIQVIILFYPSMYGAHYDINKHNPDLNNQLQQKTNIFVIDDINFYLKYGEQRDGDDQEDYYDGKSSYYLVLDFSKQTEIFTVVFLCSIYCKVSKQSYTFIRSLDIGDVDHSNVHYIELTDFGFTTTLSTLVCDVQIVNMLKADTIYEYPVMIRQNAYLLEWNIDQTLVDMFKKCIANNSNQVFESQIFYDLFKLRCYPNEKNCLLLSIQLLSLPMNRPCKDKTSGLRTTCVIFETETQTQIPAFEATFDYTEGNSAFATTLMKSSKVNDFTQLKFRVEITIYNIDEPRYYGLTHVVRNFHDGNANRGIRRNSGRRRRGGRRGRGRGR